MATKSIYKSVHVRDKAFCRRLVSALENAEKKGSKEVVLSKKVTTIDNEQAGDFLKHVK